ncbi:MAG TPA: hydroxyacid dehydrogenase, partial [Chloroflexota bacterium]|nr:hydroxyacid dehydrogenase [Chloroflexota bacterium]
AEIDGILVRTAAMPAERIARAARLKVIGKHGVGVDNIDLAAARARGITVVFTPGANAEAVAEHAFTMILMLSRRVTTYSRLLREDKFEVARAETLSNDLLGKTLGLVGLGNVGTRLAKMCRGALDMRVVAFDPYVTPARAAELGVELVSDLTPLFEAADVVSVHTPLTPETRGIIGPAALARMKPSAILINCARGGLVDEAALLDALTSNRLAGAGLDTWATEPTPTDHPLLRLENVVATPHIAGSSQEAFQLVAETVAEDVLTVLRGDAPRYPMR